MSRGWIGVDLDGTLAVYDGWKGHKHIGDPITPMVNRVIEWLVDGKEVRVFTARVSEKSFRVRTEAERAIEEWCYEHIGQPLRVTCVKDFNMLELWDDRAITVEQNTGRKLGQEQPRFTP